MGSLRGELVSKSREAALSAIRVFNDPMTKFKSESFVVLMIIAWTYLLHARMTPDAERVIKEFPEVEKVAAMDGESRNLARCDQVLTANRASASRQR